MTSNRSTWRSSTQSGSSLRAATFGVGAVSGVRGLPDLTRVHPRRTIAFVDSRWLPLFAAGLGVLGGIAGALVGGYVANQGQEERFQRERAAAIADLRIDEYSGFLGSAQEVFAADVLGFSDDERAAARVKLATAQARVALVRKDPDVERTADAVVAVLFAEEPQEEEYAQAGARFLEASRDEIGVNDE
jgi:hypothetical protein